MDDPRTRQAFRDLAEHYAAACDRRRPDTIAGLFTEDGVLLISRPGDTAPSTAYRGRAAIAEAMTGLNRYRVTSHAVTNQLTDTETATAETYCTASHVYETPDGDRLFVMTIRYEEAFILEDGRWLFASRHARRLDRGPPPQRRLATSTPFAPGDSNRTTGSGANPTSVSQSAHSAAV
ncbi:nuclear transport factor 2 family protein [Actinomadura harenae]|uniref:nuclear transport factor 2 family protein n=1 Tax=Actinomadura harenae TaxID=2483351 RepID=UPI0013153C30|nr:nuclear transport factor 2 family protein [Actinomadura harenae]